jgi:repressor LexA
MQSTAEAAGMSALIDPRTSPVVDRSGSGTGYELNCDVLLAVGPLGARDRSADTCLQRSAWLSLRCPVRVAVMERAAVAQSARLLAIRVSPEVASPNAVSQAVFVPLVGQIRAGEPAYAEQRIEEAFPLPRQLVGGGTLFLLKVVGDSMIEAAIADGDWVVVRQQPMAENGEIVAAMIEGEATVKTLKWTNGEIWLVPSNPAYEPIPGGQTTILGKVVALLRRL